MNVKTVQTHAQSSNFAAELQTIRHHVYFAFCLVLRDNVKIPCIQCRNVKWFGSHSKVMEKNGKNVIFGQKIFCIGLFQHISVYM